MTWALVFILATARSYTPQHVELYQTRQQCMAAEAKYNQGLSIFEPRAQCAPVSKQP